MSGARRILVAGIGNVFLGDDAFGVEVVRALSGRGANARVDLVDFGIRGLDLTYALTDGYAAAILVDAAPRGGAPGTLYVLDPDEGEGTEPVDPHGLDPARALAAARRLGEIPPVVRIVGCEPERVDGSLEGSGLSPAVRAAVGPAADVVERLVAEVADA